ncbi:DUF2061 domain-containing protein [Autumnicola psychrophila]|uniref:DUF2061 domain-containing protein n=1 Tax=Autumnicola psychrophila TaxID=3075592 RepID=A0ABU3DU28_9FLAO|nr:DUF2061 domain-containing protein [Zunongwangia sp. F225]MDT0686592.1 DUF2061 domain-containing protein [Zunongwangia sp. F225]
MTWRMVGTIDTILLSWLISGNPYTGLKIGFAEVVTKMLLYYVHERIWYNIRAGVTKKGDSKKRHIVKSLTWRIIGTVDTIILAWIISGDPLVGLQVGGAEVVTKMILYYFHERAWYKLDYGLENRRSKNLKN